MLHGGTLSELKQTEHWHTQVSAIATLQNPEHNHFDNDEWALQVATHYMPRSKVSILTVHHHIPY